MMQTRMQADWRLAGSVLAGLLLLVLVLYSATVTNIVTKWSQSLEGDYAHGFLVLAISMFMVYAGRQQLLLLQPCVQPFALPAIMAASLLWLVAWLVDVQMVQAMALVWLLLAVTWTVTGNRVTRQLLWPVLFLCFAIPIWSPLSPLLQQLTADVVFWLTRAAGIPAMRYEQSIVVPGGTLSIEEACSGLRYLLAALTLGVFYAWLNYRTLKARLLVVLVAVLAAIASNILRVFIVVYLAYRTRMQHPWVSDHLAFGWWLFGGMLAVLLIVDVWLAHRRPQSPPMRVEAVADAGPGCRYGAVAGVLIALSAALLLAAGPLLAAWLQTSEHEPVAVDMHLPKGRLGWQGPHAVVDAWRPHFPGAVAERQQYDKGGARVVLFIGRYPAQQQGRELISDLNRIAGRDGWQAQPARVLPAHNGRRAVIARRIDSPDGEPRLVWYWYRVAGVSTTSPYLAKLLQVYGLLSGKRDAAVTAVATILDDETLATARLADFIQGHEPWP